MLSLSAGVVASPITTTFASTSMSDSTNKNNIITKNRTFDNKVDILNYGHTQYNSKMNQTSVSVSDIELRDYLLALGYKPSQLGSLGLLKSYGVTKIIWYGTVFKGNADVYLSQGALITIKTLGVGKSVLSAIVSSITGHSSDTSKKMVEVIDRAIKVSTTQNGIILLIRGFKYLGSMNQ